METVIRKGIRNSSIEILRIIAMLIIVISHFSSHGVNDVIPLTELKPCFNRVFLQSIPLGNLGVDIFMIITGYFGVKSKFKAEKIIKLILQVFFYSALIYLIFISCGFADFSVKGAIGAFFPTVFRKYWFFTSYIFIYLLSPLINRLLLHINRKQHIILIAVLFAFYRVLPCFIHTGIQATDLIAVYIIGAYLRLYPDSLIYKKKARIPILISALIFTFGSVIIINLLSEKSPDILNQYSFFYSRVSLNMLLISAELFMIFSGIHLGEKKVINAVSACTFGVYLIHDNDFIRPILWNNIVHASDYVYSKALVLFIPAVAAAIFIVCTAIDFIRQKTIEKPVMAAVNAVCGKIRIKAAEIYDKKNQRS